MNLQSVIVPIGEMFQWFFQHVLVHLLGPMNIICILGGFFGIGLWLRMQKNFTEAAKKNSTII
jgi:hypothetical protein